MTSFDAIVLAGGGAARLGGSDKPALVIGGTTLLDRVIDAVPGAGRVIVVGPRRDTRGEVRWTREEPAGGGPVAAIAAGLALVGAPVVVVLAADLPWVAPAVPALLTAVGTADAAVLDDNPLVAAWRTEALRSAVTALDDVNGARARALLRQATVCRLDDHHGWAADCDTWDDVALAREQAARDRLGR